jgi:metal-responsive CopG/Arc/MetJ family transcriptional regulator
MKTAISIPDPIYKAAERASKRMGISRSRLYTLAIEKLLQAERSKEITEQLNEVHRKENSRMDPAWMAMQITSLPTDDENW